MLFTAKLQLAARKLHFETVFGCSLKPAFKVIRAMDYQIIQTSLCRRWTPQQHQEALDTLTLMREQFDRLINDLDAVQGRKNKRRRDEKLG